MKAAREEKRLQGPNPKRAGLHRKLPKHMGLRGPDDAGSRQLIYTGSWGRGSGKHRNQSETHPGDLGVGAVQRDVDVGVRARAADVGREHLQRCSTPASSLLHRWYTSGLPGTASAPLRRGP